MPALIYASRYDNLNIVKMLLEKGASIDIQDNYGYNALIAASIAYRIDIVKMLLERGANFSIQDNNGKTFMCYIDEKYKDEIHQIVDRLSGAYIKG